MLPKIKTQDLDFSDMGDNMSVMNPSKQIDRKNTLERKMSISLSLKSDSDESQRPMMAQKKEFTGL